MPKIKLDCNNNLINKMNSGFYLMVNVKIIKLRLPHLKMKILN